MTKKIFSLFIVLAVALSIAAVSTAQKKDSDKITLTGNIVDKACATGRRKKDDAQASIDAHKKSCSLMENCLKSGLGVYADGKYTEFDEKGAAMAKAALEKSAKDNGAKFKVMGKMDGEKLAVESISEVQ